jgi:hypothetical protein
MGLAAPVGCSAYPEERVGPHLELRAVDTSSATVDTLTVDK